jgi:hypothetical protein
MAQVTLADSIVAHGSLQPRKEERWRIGMDPDSDTTLFFHEKNLSGILGRLCSVRAHLAIATHSGRAQMGKSLV